MKITVDCQHGIIRVLDVAPDEVVPESRHTAKLVQGAVLGCPLCERAMSPMVAMKKGAA